MRLQLSLPYAVRDALTPEAVRKDTQALHHLLITALLRQGLATADVESMGPRRVAIAVHRARPLAADALPERCAPILAACRSIDLIDDVVPPHAQVLTSWYRAAPGEASRVDLTIDDLPPVPNPFRR